MKLSPVTRGPVTLSAIEYAPRLSRETSAFEAKVTINGLSAPVFNDGNGGPNVVSLVAVSNAIKTYADTLPPLESKYGSLPMDQDLLLSLMLEEAIQVHEDKKYRKKGFTHYVSKDGKAAYLTLAPTEADLTKFFGSSEGVKVRELAP